MKMTKKEYLEEHIPHRINLLTTFRDRFKNNGHKERGYYARDFFRCSKDMSIIMSRFFLSELGIKLQRKTNQLIKEEDKDLLWRITEFNIQPLDPKLIEADQSIHSILVEILKAGNRAVAHLDNTDVNHFFKDYIHDEIIFQVIDYIESQISLKIYKTKKEYDRVMQLDNNQMHRDRLVMP
jgi:hypothetical protein